MNPRRTTGFLAKNQRSRAPKSRSQTESMSRMNIDPRSSSNSRSTGPGWRVRGAIVLAVVTLVTVSSGVTAGAGSEVVTTKTGVRTHGSIKTSASTVGWLLTCALSHRLPDDPITAPGQRGGAHMHDFTGNASIDANSTLKSMEDPANNAVADKFNGGQVKSGTSCNMSTYDGGTAGDTAAYWRPTLYANGQPVTSTVKDQLYYRAKTLSGTFSPIPQDARIIVGSHAATSVATNPALVEEHIYWECNGDSDEHYQTPPNHCSSILENVVFPSCWDGRAMDHRGLHGTDNQHFTYPDDSACPAAYPVQMPQLSEKFKYDHIPTGATLSFSADPGMAGLMPTYTAHADFWNTWNPVAMQYLVTNCLNAHISCGTNPVTPLR